MKQPENKIIMAVLIFLTIVLSPLLIICLKPTTAIGMFFIYVICYGTIVIFTKSEPLILSIAATYIIWMIIFLVMSYDHVIKQWKILFKE